MSMTVLWSVLSTLLFNLYYFPLQVTTTVTFLAWEGNEESQGEVKRKLLNSLPSTEIFYFSSIGL
jgi:hypothetical protein